MQLLYIQTCWINHNVNIAHFLHDILFHAIDFYLNNQNIKIKFILSNKLREWETCITLLFIEYFNIDYSIEEFNFMHRFKNSRNLTMSKNYTKIFNILKEIISKKYNINYDNNYRVLYGRSDCNSRRLLNIDNIINKFDLIIDDMSKLTFEEQVKIFMKTSHLITTEGAHLTNIIFMNKNAKILDICNTHNSWQKMFGTSNLIKHFELFINKPGNFNDNIIIDNNLENKILNFIK